MGGPGRVHDLVGDGEANRAWDERRETRFSRRPNPEGGGIIGALMASESSWRRRLTKEFRGFVAVKDAQPAGAPRDDPRPDRAERGGKTPCSTADPLPRPTRGRITFKRAGHHGRRPATSRASGWCARSRSRGVPHLTVLENVRIALQRRRDARSTSGVREGPRGAGAARAELLEAVGSGLRGHHRGRAAVRDGSARSNRDHAGAGARDDVLDEPHRGHAHEDVDRISALIKQVARNRTVLLVEHNLGVWSTCPIRSPPLPRRGAREGTTPRCRADRSDPAYMGSGHA